MCAIATPSATACYAAAEDKDIPVIFTAITDPEEAKLTGGNITGTSDKLPIEGQLELIRKVQPDAKTIGILYTTSEPNSVSAVKEYQEKAGEYGFKIEALGVMTQAEVNQATDTLISKGVDCFTNLTDNNVVGVLPSILEKTNEAGIPVYGSEIEQVKLGCVASAGIEYVALGRQTGMMAAKILKGGLEIVNEEGVVSPAYTILRARNEIIPLFFYTFFRSYWFINSKLRISVEGIRDGKSINMNTFWHIKVPVPSIEEQRHISALISSIDNRIKIAEFEYKRLLKIRVGLMQQLFI